MAVRRILIAAVLAAALVPATASAQGVGEIGGPPTMGGHLRFPAPHKKTFVPRATSEPIVIGVGFNFFGKVEIVGQDTRRGLCIFVDHPRSLFQSFSCNSVVADKAISPNTMTWETFERRSRSLSELSGRIQPSVASVTAVAHRRKGHKRTRKTVPGIVAVPGPDLLAKLHQPAPFGFFVADFRGCLEDAKVRFHAFDASGALLGSSHVNLGFPNRFTDVLQPCEPGFGIVVFGTASAAQAAVAP